MTDQELLALVQAKTPDELSLEEIDLLRTRLAESTELREALFGQMQMEAYLAEALGRVNFTPQEIIARAHAGPARFQLTVPLVCVILALPICLLLLTALWNAVTTKKVEVATVPMAGETKDEVKKGAKEPESTGKKTDVTGKKISSTDNSSKPAVEKTPPGTGTKAETKRPAAEANPAAAAAVTPPSPPVIKDPWQEVIAAQGDLPSFQDVAFQDFETAKTLPRRADLQKWFEPVPGQNYRIVETDTQRGRCGVLEGSARMRAPWTKDSAFKFAVENYKGLILHFYHGQEGVTLAYFQDAGDKWAAWKTTRKLGSLRPETLALTATDDDRARRSEVRFGGPMEIRWRGGELIFSRGDIVLLTAPLAQMPEDVYFEGRATFLGIAVKRTSDDPVPLPSLPIAFETNKPAELAWQLSKPDIAKLEKLPDGALRLSADKAKEKIQAFMPLPFSGLGEVILELDDITPGAGVYLGKEGGLVQEVVRFQKNTRNGQLGVRVTYPDESAEADLGTLADRPTPLVGSHCWIKLLQGCGNFRWWVSCDGQHWAQPEMAWDNSPGNRGFIGLQVVANRPDTHLTLKRIEFRELAGLSALAAKEICDKAIAFTAAPTVGFWTAEVARRQPAGVDAAEWRRACAIRSLGAGLPRELAYALLELLLDDAAARKLPLETQLAALNDAALLVWDFRDGQAMKVSVGRRFLELGQRKYEEEGLPPWSSVRRHAMSVPVVTYLQQPATPDANLRWELIQAANNRKPDETLRLLRQIRFFQQTQYAPLVDWAEANARRDLPGRAAGDLATRLKDSWRHPLVEELSKETYNSLTELQAVLESEAWQDAARMVTSLDPEAAPGVAPYYKDKDLLVSLPVAVRQTLADYPQLRQALGQQFGTLAKLRIGQAMAGGDASALELATIQFAGTEAAAEAHRWLGDRALSSGWFERAITEYRRSTQIQPAFAGDVSPRLRLAAAMLGQDAEQPVTKAVAFGEVKMTKEQFEALIAEMRARGNTSVAAVTASAPPAPQNPANFQVNLKAKLDGPLGANPQEEVGRRTNQFRVPWVDRQLATVLEGNVLYVSNRFQVAAYNLASGQRTWQTAAPPGAMAKAQDWAMIAMKPLVTQSHVYARLLYGPSPMLVCLEKGTGKIVWNSQQHEREFLVSDPILVQGQLAALSITLLEQQEGQLKWNVFDSQTGELISQKDLIRLRSTWGSRGCCEVAPLEDSVIAVLGGVTISCDAAGNLKWVRRQVVLPSDEDPRWILQLYQRPLVEDSRLYVSQPGVRAVDCLDVHSGARHWTSVIPDVVGVIGLSEGKLLVRTETDVRALDKMTSKLLWRRDLTELHSFTLLSSKTLVVAQREQVPMQNNQMQNRLSWLDLATGEILATTVLPNLNDPDPRLGPLVQFNDRFWTFFGKGQHEPARDLVELAPAGEVEKVPLPLPLLEQLWSRSVPANQQAAARKFFPDWQLLASSPGDRTGLMPEVHGEKDVLGLRATAQSPVVFARQIALPAGSKPRLRIRVGNDPGQNWKLTAAFGDKELHAVNITDATHPDRYKQLEIDLSPVAGQSGTLVVQAQFVSTGDASALFWKALEVLF